VPKAFVTVGGRTLLEHAAGTFAAHPRVRDVIVVAPSGLVDRAREVVPGACVVAGGASRQESVGHGLRVLAADVDAVLVHDVARALVPSELISRVLDGLRLAGADAAVPFLPISDTIRRVDESGWLGDVVDRATLQAMQTPQGFARAVLERAHAEARGDATDDAALVQAIGGRVAGVRGDARAFKITVPLDLVLAEAMLERFGDDLDGPWWDVDHG
jgi:2-C-methyl-D-erythritol 4-phosphate cytidylyltransferase